jgi:hypothetical protein
VMDKTKAGIRGAQGLWAAHKGKTMGTQGEDDGTRHRP